jgi:hypothetical protein
MSKIETFTEHRVEYVKLVVEHVLQSTQFRENSELPELIHSLSTDPMKVGSNINCISLHNTCGTLNYELWTGLMHANMKTDRFLSNDNDTREHIYLSTIDTYPIIIDCSIGQIILGHNHVFVGTRRQLRNLVVNQTSEFGRYKIVSGLGHTPEEVFKRMWGNTGIKYIPR